MSVSTEDRGLFARLARAAFACLAGIFVLAVLALPQRAAAQPAPSLALSKTASPETYSAVGDVITYKYVLENDGSTPIGSPTLTDDLVPQADLNCSLPPILFIGDTVTCTGTYKITQADITAGSVTNTATATGMPFIDGQLQGGPGERITVAEAGAPRRRSLWGSLAYHLNPIGTAHAQVMTVTATATATVTFVPEEEEEEPLDTRPQTKAVIERFLTHRMFGLLNDEPDRARYIRRVPGTLWGNGANGSPTPFDMAQSQQDGTVAFSTSLSQMRNAVASADTNALDDKAMTLGSAALYERPGPSPYTGFDVWTEAHFTSYEDTGGADGDFNILYVGADYAFSPDWLIGFLGQFDWTEESTRADGSRVDGDGWMIGPYLSGRVTDNVYFDWRAAWGGSDNGVSPFGTYTNTFDTTRWLTTARLTGNWTSGNWRVTPSAAFKYGEEQLEHFVDSAGFLITGPDVAVGQVEFGPEFAYRWQLSGGTVIEPQVALYGVWNFEDNALLVNNTVFSPEDFTARLEGGAQIYTPGGWSVRGAAAFDGIGADYEAVTGKVWLNWPLN